jgi:hypothetical protein
MASNDNSNSTPGLGSENMDAETKKKIHQMGGEASAKSRRGAAGSTEAANRGGKRSHRS